MEKTRIILSGLWIVLMLIFLLGDVLRIFSGDYKSGVMGNMEEVTQGMWLGIAVLMLTPIIMVFLSLVLNYPVTRWTNIVMAVVWFLFNISSISTYPSAYDKFLLIVSLLVNVTTVWYAWQWV